MKGYTSVFPWRNRGRAGHKSLQNMPVHIWRNSAATIHCFTTAPLSAVQWTAMQQPRAPALGQARSARARALNGRDPHLAPEPCRCRRAEKRCPEPVDHRPAPDLTAPVAPGAAAMGHAHRLPRLDLDRCTPNPPHSAWRRGRPEHACPALGHRPSRADAVTGIATSTAVTTRCRVEPVGPVKGAIARERA